MKKILHPLLESLIAAILVGLNWHLLNQMYCSHFSVLYIFIWLQCIFNNTFQLIKSTLFSFEKSNDYHG